MKLICGIVRLDGADADAERLHAMAAALNVPRLRPKVALWRSGPAGQAVLDFAPRGACALPERGNAVLAADLRLDEGESLRMRTETDGPSTEESLLLFLLEKTGPAGLKDILGDFAFALWNRDTRRLLCARDIFGIRPFAYVHQPGRFFAFASFPAALHGAGIVPKKIDETVLAHRMVHSFRADECLVSGIMRLPPAHFLEVSGEGLSITRYWELDRSKAGTNRCAPADASRELRRLMEEATKCRLSKTGEVGAHLSGGLDSSAISVLAARELRGGGRILHAYSFLDRQRNDIAPEDETEFVQAILDQERDLDWTPIRPPVALAAPGDALDIDKMTFLGQDEPENDTCARAEEQGVGVILSGWGGDEGATFNGRGALAEMFLRGRWSRVLHEARAMARERRRPLERVLYNEIAAYLVPAPVIDWAKRIVGKNPNLRTLFKKTLSARARGHLDGAPKGALSTAPDARENRWYLMTSPHIAERTEVWAQTGARHGLAFAFPMLDRRVVEFCLSLPSELFLRDGFRRRVFRDAMQDVLPDRVRLRHEKYQPFPSRMLDLAENKDEFLKRVDGYADNENVRRMIDLEELRLQIEKFPSPELVRKEMHDSDNPASHPSLLAAWRTLIAADYIAQHGTKL